jgi:hypothetical protein
LGALTEIRATSLRTQLAWGHVGSLAQATAQQVRATCHAPIAGGRAIRRITIVSDSALRDSVERFVRADSSRETQLRIRHASFLNKLAKKQCVALPIIRESMRGDAQRAALDRL